MIQWRSENESKVIGSYEPKYEKNDKGHLAEWDSIEIKWYTANGQQPADRLRECAILTDFANAMDLKCENAISLAFVAGFGSLFILVLLIFVILKRRYIFFFYHLQDNFLENYTFELQDKCSWNVCANAFFIPQMIQRIL